MELTPEQQAVLRLHLIPDMGPRRFRSLTERFGSALQALDAPVNELAAAGDIGDILARQIVRAKSSVDIEAEIRSAEKAGAAILTWAHEEYPAALRVIQDPPVVVYWQGALPPPDLLAVGVVGTRRPTAYGRAVAARFCRDMAERGIIIVSGLARGIDTEAHEAALAARSTTIAVLGSGLNCLYPPENRKLAERIARQGVLVSEFPMGMPPDRGNFPRRNRIIAALSAATLVVEADIKSGALITARYAAEQGKEVFAVPGPVFSRGSQGTHYLLKSGAQLAESADDILTVIQPLAELMPRPNRVQEDAGESRESVPAGGDSGRVLEILGQSMEPVSIDHIAGSCSLPAGAASAILLELELRGLVRSLPGKMYIKKY